MIITENDIEERQEGTPVNAPSLLLAALAIISRTRTQWSETSERANPELPASGRALAARARVAEKQSATR